MLKFMRTDLAFEAHELERGEAQQLEGVISSVSEHEGMKITTVEIINETGAERLGKNIGKYITIDVPGIKYSTEIYEAACKALAEKIRSLAEIEPDTLTLVVGLGNDGITPDRIGTMTASEIMVTNHLKNYIPEFFDGSVGVVCAISPGVMGTTGMETSDVVAGIVKKLKPDLVIVVDALAAADFSRIGVTVQLSDAGIQPGAGVGNNRSAISEKTLGVPVIAIGVPTVVDAMSLPGVEKREGAEPLIVTPRDIDLIVERCAKTISGGINLALHNGLTLSEIEEYVG